MKWRQHMYWLKLYKVERIKTKHTAILYNEIVMLQVKSKYLQNRNSGFTGQYKNSYEIDISHLTNAVGTQLSRYIMEVIHNIS